MEAELDELRDELAATKEELAIAREMFAAIGLHDRRQIVFAREAEHRREWWATYNAALPVALQEEIPPGESEDETYNVVHEACSGFANRAHGPLDRPMSFKL